MNETLNELIAFVKEHDGINDKSRLATLVIEQFKLTRDRSVFYCREFAVRFSAAASTSFSNTVLSLSNLQKVDDRPFVVCLVTPKKNHLLLANTTLLRKISHSSQKLREDNIRGSFNGSDISRKLDGIPNIPANLSRLFDIHAEIGFEGNLPRLVEATNDISPSGVKFVVTTTGRQTILDAPNRAVDFLASQDSATLKDELDGMVEKFRNEILVAALIENVNVRGRVIEYLIAGEDKLLRQSLVTALRSKDAKGLPQFKTDNTLGDYTRVFDQFHTETDVKTKLLVLSSNPKAYNIDKILDFLAKDRTVFMFYFVGIDPGKIANTVLISMFQKRLVAATLTLKHWAGRNSRGVTQFEGKVIGDLIEHPEDEVDVPQATKFLNRLIDL